eukprot:6738085-Prymnesium_polylepis.1
MSCLCPCECECGCECDPSRDCCGPTSRASPLSSQHVNEALGDDVECSHLLPLRGGSMDIFEAAKDGVLLCKLINKARAVMAPQMTP